MANTNSLQLFSGAGQYLFDATASSILRITGNLTLEAWVKPFTLDQVGVIEKGDGAGFQSYRIWISKTGFVTFEISRDGTNWDTLVAATAIPMGGTQWNHIACVYDSAANKMYIYLNGVLSSTKTLTGGNSIASYATELRVGTKDTTWYYNYLIDEIRIWNTVRTQAQIQANYLRELFGSESGLVAYYNLDGNYQDKTANHLNLGVSGLPNFQTDVPFADNTTTSTSTTTTSTSTTTTSTSTSTTTTSTSSSTTTTSTSTSTTTTLTSTSTTQTTTSTSSTTSTTTTLTSTSTSTTTSTSTSTTITIPLRFMVEKVR